MVVLWANGKVVDTVSEADLGPRLLRCTEDGRAMGEYAPPAGTEPPVPWDPSITEEEVQRRLAEPGFTFDQVKQQLGWQ
jgi:hypothetical protein